MSWTCPSACSGGMNNMQRWGQLHPIEVVTLASVPPDWLKQRSLIFSNFNSNSLAFLSIQPFWSEQHSPTAHFWAFTPLVAALSTGKLTSCVLGVASWFLLRDVFRSHHTNPEPVIFDRIPKCSGQSARSCAKCKDSKMFSIWGSRSCKQRKSKNFTQIARVWWSHKSWAHDFPQDPEVFLGSCGKRHPCPEQSCHRQFHDFGGWTMEDDNLEQVSFSLENHVSLIKCVQALWCRWKHPQLQKQVGLWWPNPHQGALFWLSQISQLIKS